jgi:hypothetical protein
VRGPHRSESKEDCACCYRRIPMVRFGFRVPSLRKRIAARTSIKRLVKNKLGLRAPRGWGWITNPKKAAYNRVYSRTTRGRVVLVIAMVLGVAAVGVAVAMSL